MVSKIKSRVRLGITTIIPESRNSLGAKVPCYNLVGTIQRLCAYSKAMISQGTGTSILNMQNNRKSIRSEAPPPPLPPGPPRALLPSLLLKLQDEEPAIAHVAGPPFYHILKVLSIGQNEQKKEMNFSISQFIFVRFVQI